MLYAQQTKVIMHIGPCESKVISFLYLPHNTLEQAERMQYGRTDNIKSGYGRDKFCDLISELCEVDVAPDGTMSHGRVIRRYTRMADRYVGDSLRSWDRLAAPAPFDGCECGLWRYLESDGKEWVADGRDANTVARHTAMRAGGVGSVQTACYHSLRACEGCGCPAPERLAFDDRCLECERKR